MDLRYIRKVNEFCQEREINLLFKPDGKIQVIVGNEAGFIEYDQINELIQKLKKDEQQ
jgi:phosphotransferase system IIB component